MLRFVLYCHPSSTPIGEQRFKQKANNPISLVCDIILDLVSLVRTLKHSSLLDDENKNKTRNGSMRAMKTSLVTYLLSIITLFQPCKVWKNHTCQVLLTKRRAQCFTFTMVFEWVFDDSYVIYGWITSKSLPFRWFCQRYFKRKNGMSRGNNSNVIWFCCSRRKNLILLSMTIVTYFVTFSDTVRNLELNMVSTFWENNWP